MKGNEKKKGKGRENYSVISFGQGKETEFLTYRKIPKSNMWLEQSRVKVTFMHKISRMTTSLTVTKLKLETDVTGKFIDFPVCVIRYIFIRKLSHFTISSPFILINQENA